MIDLIAQPSFTDLVQALELVETGGIAVRHNQAMEKYRQALVAECLDFPNLSQHASPLRNKHVLAVMGVDVRRDHAVDGPGKRSIQPVSEHGFENRALEEPVLFSFCALELGVTWLPLPSLRVTAICRIARRIGLRQGRSGFLF